MNQFPPPYSHQEPVSPVEPPAAAVQVKLPSRKPLVTYTLLGFTVLVYLAQMATDTALGLDLPAALGMKVNHLIAQGQIWRLFTPMFLHGSILHIGLNMYALHIFGPTLERHFGHFRFFLLYVLAGFAGNVASMLLSPAPSLGASTSIFGLMAAEGVFIYGNRAIFGPSARMALNQILMMGIANLLFSLRPGIDLWGHLGGLIGGLLFTLLGGPLLALQGSYPTVEIVDNRPAASVALAVLVVGGLFSAAALFKIFS